MSYIDDEKTFLYQFVPEKFEYLTKKRKVRFNGINLKTDLLINLMNEFIMKYFSSKQDEIDKEIKMNVWSIIIKRKYGSFYNYYIDYLVEYNFILLESDYFSGKKSRTYKLNMNSILNLKRVKITDKVLLKKHTKEYLETSFLTNNNSPIDIKVRKKLVDDLYSVNIDYVHAITFINNMFNNKELSYNKFQKNKIMIESLGIKHIYFKFDEYGRMHTNYTVLKKDIRKNFIKWNNEDMEECDLPNSQPLFLAVLMKNTLPVSHLFNPEFNKYFDLVKNGVLYDYFAAKYNKDRKEIKNMIYRVLFGSNNGKDKNNVMFKVEFPLVYDFIKTYKKNHNDYRVVSHALQNLESKFIFNRVVKHIMDKYDYNIPIITIHDSLFFPVRYKKEVCEIFEYHQRKLLEDTTVFS